MSINDSEGGFFVEGLKGSRRPCHAETMYRAACGGDGAITGKTEFYLSLHTFPAAFIEQLKTTGKTAGYCGETFSRWLWFDIDREGDLPAALEAASRLADFLVKDFVPDTESLSLWFSGAKGFHVGLPVSVFGGASPPAVAFHTQCKAVAVEVARLAGVEVDTAIYDRVRLFRCPNTRHGKTGLYKIPISFWELTGIKNLGAILDWAKAPRRQSPTPGEGLATVICRADVPEVPPAAAFWSEVCRSMSPVLAVESEEREGYGHAGRFITGESAGGLRQNPVALRAAPAGCADNPLPCRESAASFAENMTSRRECATGFAGLPLPASANAPTGQVKCQT